jgi:glc operon protein GlcG
MRHLREIGHQDAASIVAFIQARLDAEGLGAAAAVVDRHGELIAFLRTDGCPLPSINNAIHKAFTAVRERTESAAIGEKSRIDDFPITNFGDLRYTGWGGGIPIVFDGDVVGAVGVSGLPEADDIEIARAAATFITEGEESTNE